MLNFLKKDFLVGMGAGFILSGIMIAYFGIGQPTDEEIRARAAKLGMTEQLSGEKKPPNTNADEKDSLPVDKTVPTYTSESVNKPISKDKPVSTDKPISTDKTTSDKSSVSENAKKPTNVVIEIKPGMGSETVARILEEKGVVKDKDEFYKVVTAKRAHAKFKVGKFSVPAGGDMEEILSILTRK